MLLAHSARLIDRHIDTKKNKNFTGIPAMEKGNGELGMKKRGV